MFSLKPPTDPRDLVNIPRLIILPASDDVPLKWPVYLILILRIPAGP